MNLLLDTHALIWFLEDHDNLSKQARTAIGDRGNRSFVSDATAWEVAIKHSMGKLDLPVPFEYLFPNEVVDKGFEVLTIKHRHLYRLLNLPKHHGDPFDRLIIAQAQEEGMTIVTRDSHFSAYSVPLLW